MTQNKFKIAITGGIGSGKSAVAEIIGKLGYAVYSCDKIYSELLNSSDFIEKLFSAFSDIKSESGTFDRRKLADIVFSDNEQLKRLNALVHPAIMKRAFELLKNDKIGFCEVPLLFENSYEELFDGVIVVLRDKNERIKSVIKRSNLSQEEVKNRINLQFNYDNCNFAKYYVIHNDGNLTDLEAETVNTVNKIIEKYLKKVF